MADENNETEAAEGVLDENQNIVTEDEIKVDDGASMAEIAAAHAQAVEDEKQVSLEDTDGVEGARRQDAGEASSGGTVMDGAAAAATAEAPSLGRKVREGLVASTKMDKTAIVVAQDRVRHRRYNKTMQRDKRLYVHDEENDMNVGDRVRVIETRPLSKNKRWRLLEIVERAR